MRLKITAECVIVSARRAALTQIYVVTKASRKWMDIKTACTILLLQSCTRSCEGRVKRKARMSSYCT